MHNVNSVSAYGVFLHALSPQLLYRHPLGTMILYTVTHTPCIVCCCSCRIEIKVVSLCVYKHGDWLQLSTHHDRYDCINTLVIHCVPLLIVFLYQLVIMTYSHIFDTQCTHHSFISSDHLTQFETVFYRYRRLFSENFVLL